MAANVLHILGCAALEAAGVVRMVWQLARHISPERYRMLAWFLNEGGPLVSELEAAGVEVRIVPWRGVRDPVGAFRFRRELKARRIDIVHQHAGGESVRWLVRHSSDARVVLHLHGYVAEARMGRPAKRRLKGVDAAIAVSQAVARSSKGPPPCVIYPGVEIPPVSKEHASQPLSGQKTPLTIGTAGRLVQVKNFPFLIQVVRSLTSEFPDLILEIAGEGPERPVLESLVSKLEIQDRVRLLGWQQNLPAVMLRWDVFALGSLAEGFGLAVTEAMACGLPVVSTAVGGIPEIVAEGVTGWLVPPGDVDSYRHRLRFLLTDAGQRRAFGAAGRHRVQELFSVGQMADSVQNIYHRLLAQGSPAESV